ncbi:MAG: Asp-tRNA(Asn)/Glu-tRNA(Gln) amidotransferase subunit GatA, partial [Proteobacteria bacterium]|nr:Asp-tRNA(Asn)/Glu-tRNA(Gln) amidotransferase subunit GatA [Pseudomonadota bacterium]
MSSSQALNELTAHELSDLLGRREVSAREVLEATWSRLEDVDEEIGAYILRTREAAESQAAASDEQRARGKQLSPLAGVPLALKDIYCTKGIETTCCSRILKGFI